MVRFPVLVAGCASALAFAAGAHARVMNATTSGAAKTNPTPFGVARLMDADPNLPFDPNTEPTCSWWWDNEDNAIPCESMHTEWGITKEDFLAWVCTS